jgi:hypothetical protein
LKDVLRVAVVATLCEERRLLEKLLGDRVRGLSFFIVGFRGAARFYFPNISIIIGRENFIEEEDDDEDDNDEVTIEDTVES